MPRRAMRLTCVPVGSMPHSILCVLGLSPPAQVVRSVVQPVSVDMARFLIWTFLAMEGSSDDSMDNYFLDDAVNSRFAAEIPIYIQCLLQYLTAMDSSAPVDELHHTIH